ncbi:MAG TPA: hypothetical protein VGS12_08735 [Caulobacteraceae bacterium]|nr:hypothetical protein [Caulobacteraceae bacterium]
MRLSVTPQLRSGRSLAFVAFLVSLIMWVALAITRGKIAGALGDTDDAMRLVLARSLLHGAGWYDQLVMRLQPPLGTYMHWSQLLTGLLAGLIWIVSRFTSMAEAEWAVRFAWPLLLIFPAVAAGLTVARRLGAGSAALLTAVLMVLSPNLFIQFVPGRIDHHNVQIMLAMWAFAAALAADDSVAWGAAAGAISGLGLAIGLEAMLFHALVGASFALRMAFDPKKSARPAIAYGLALTAATFGFFALQTPPWRWGLSWCDDIGLNLIAAVAIAGLGLVAVAALAPRLTTPARLAMVAAIGAAGAAAWLAIDPACLHGPFEAVDPRVRPFWFDRILEIQPWWRSIVSDRDSTIGEMTMAALALLAALFLVLRRWRRPDAGALLALALIIIAIGANADARRMQSYVVWFGVPVLGAALSLVSFERLRGLLVPTLVATLALAPANVAFAVNTAVNAVQGKRVGGVSAAAVSCFDIANFARLSKLPPGLVLSETDLGPFILAETRDSVLAAPYHRMSWGILAAHDVLNADPASAQAMTRRLGVSYIVDCPSYPMNVSAGSFGDTLRRKTPAWLEQLSPARDRVQIYRVRPSSG